MYDSDYKIIVLKAAAALYISLLWSFDVFRSFERLPEQWGVNVCDLHSKRMHVVL